jgi:DNA-binding NtrC family response regulator
LGRRAGARILFTFAGIRDPFNPDVLVDGARSDGPVLALLAEERFDRIYVFADPPVLANGRGLLGAIRKRHPQTEASLVEVDLRDPTDYEEIFDELRRQTRTICEPLAASNPRYFISTASGTPQIQTVWFLLARAELIPATLLKVTPPRHLRPGQRAVSEVRLSLAEFPKISPGDVDALELASLRIRNEKLEAEHEALFAQVEAEGLVGRSKAIQETLRLVAKAAPTNYPILITGEPGTGKELIARAIHRKSPRAAHPLITVICSAIPDTLIESELFGYAPRAFTGADRAKKGRVELADGGTLFLDEIGDLSLPAQAKILRLLQEGEVQKVGATAHTRVDVRVVAATHKNLTQAVAERAFREDLLHRLRVIPIPVPPLRERREDIPLLLEHFLRREARDTPRRLSAKAVRLLVDYSWPGNVRELENLVKRVVALSEHRTVSEPDLPPDVRTISRPRELPVEPSLTPDGLDLEERLAEVERAYFREAIAMTHGNAAAAARLLKLKPHTFRKRARHVLGR